MWTCAKCVKMTGIVLVLLGLGFLASDLGYWTFWGLNWWTAAFLLLGLNKVMATKCPDCKKLMKKR